MDKWYLVWTGVRWTLVQLNPAQAELSRIERTR